MSFPTDKSKEIVTLIRSMRGYLTESQPTESSEKNSLLSKLWEAEKSPALPVRNQTEQDGVFSDLNELMKLVVPFWLSNGEEQAAGSVNDALVELGDKYPSDYAVSYISKLVQSIEEISEVLESVVISDRGALRHWFQVNELELEVEELSEQDIILAPLTTDYIVAHFYLHAWQQLASKVPQLYPVGWMPSMQEVTLPTSAREAVTQSSGKILVMLDRDYSGTTSNAVRRAIEKMFDGKKVFTQ
jgi:hypothetical protein